MKLFRRGNTSTQAPMPQEVQDYYQATHRDRMGLASLLAVGTLVATVAIAAGIFYGGRWVYRKTVHHTAVSTNQPTTQTSTNPSNTPSTSSQASVPTPSQSSTTTTTPAPSASPAPSTAPSLPRTGPIGDD